MDRRPTRKGACRGADAQALLVNHVAVSIRFEGRARLFRKQYPLALQVILSTGVLNGILVVRSVHSCASLLSSLMRNELDLELREDDWNYRLVERTMDSTIRVISRNTLIVNAFSAFYARQRVGQDRQTVGSDGEHIIAGHMCPLKLLPFNDRY